MSAIRLEGREDVVPNGMNKPSTSGFPRGRSAASETWRQRAQLAIVVEELFNLLEDYGPSWYTKGHHDRAKAALRDGGERLPGVLFELYHLLDEYAPRWYPKQLQVRAESLLRFLKES